MPTLVTPQNGVFITQNESPAPRSTTPFGALKNAARLLWSAKRMVAPSRPATGFPLDRHPQVPAIELMRNGQVTERLQLAAGRSEWFIGRSPECDLTIDHPTISDEHARVHLAGRAYYLTHLGSTHGTRVAGQPLQSQQPTRLFGGMQITMGEDRCVLVPSNEGAFRYKPTTLSFTEERERSLVRARQILGTQLEFEEEEKEGDLNVAAAVVNAGGAAQVVLNDPVFLASAHSSSPPFFQRFETSFETSKREREKGKEKANLLQIGRTAADDADRGLQEALAHSLSTGCGAVRNYEQFNQLKPGSATLEQVAASSAGIDGWTKNPQTTRHEAEEDGWVVPDEGEEEEGKGEPEDRRPVHAGDEEEAQALQRALLESIGVTFGGEVAEEDDYLD